MYRKKRLNLILFYHIYINFLTHILLEVDKLIGFFHTEPQLKKFNEHKFKCLNIFRLLLTISYFKGINHTKSVI